MRIVILGAGGRLGGAFVREYRDKFEILAFDHEELDLGNEKEMKEWLLPLDFDVLINAAAFTNVDLCETKREEAFQINAEAPRALAEICSSKNARLIHFSTDYVFDGENRKPYAETDPARPVSVYGKSKRQGETNVLAVQDRHLVVRVSWVFGPARPSFIDQIIQRALENEDVSAVSDKFSTPTYTLDVALMLPRFFDPDTPGGILHFANAGECSWQEYAQFAIEYCGSLGVPLKARSVGALKLVDMKSWVAQRPVYSVLSTAKYAAFAGRPPRSWRDAVADYIRHSYSKK
ncbi:MAG TPA: dTDP-4-dehydrorhamnose reductase [Chthoniobacterales bacterium]|nr:dTDP-4-dehydrorhamnose reductase [Chthoniobacterales bacterium]